MTSRPFDYEQEFCRDTVDLPVLAAVRAAQAIAEERFAGAWIDHGTTPPRVAVALVGLTTNDEAAIAAAMGEDAERVVAVGSPYSKETLRRAQESLGEALGGAGIVWSSSVHAPTNQVFLAVPDDEREVAVSVMTELDITPDMVRFEEYHQVVACD